MKKKFPILLLFVITVITVLTVTAAAEILATGKCGANATWSFDDSGILTVSGSGDIYGYSLYYQQPWDSKRASIKTIVIESGLTGIGERTFEKCYNVTSVTIPDTVVTVGDHAFNGCKALTTIDVDDNNPYFCDENGVMFNKDKSAILRFPEGSTLTSYSIPTSVKTVGVSAFFACTRLKSITIPNSVTEVKLFGFNGCTGLTSLTIPNSVTTLGPSSFAECTALTSVDIPSSVVNVSPRIFADCTGLKRVTLSTGATSVSSAAFYGCSSLETVTIPEGVTLIDSSAFRDCTSLTSVVFPSTVTETGMYSFDGCKALKDVHITDLGAWIKANFSIYNGNPLYYAANGLIMDGKPIESITIPEGVDKIETRIFRHCTKVKTLTVSSSVNYISTKVLADLKALERITVSENSTKYSNDENGVLLDKNGKTLIFYPINLTSDSYVVPSSVTGIGASAFENCPHLKKITVTKNVTSIGNYAFYNCTGLTDVRFEKGIGLTSLQNYTFAKCTSLERVDIPESLTQTGSYVFDGCTALKEVHVSDVGAWLKIRHGGYSSIPTYYADNGLYLNGEPIKSVELPLELRYIPMYALAYCSELESVVVPSKCEMTSISEWAFVNCTSLKSVTIPKDSKLSTVGMGAFSGCTSLEAIELPPTVSYIDISAFKNCSSMTKIVIHENAKTIERDVFSGCSLITVYGYTGSAAQTYANRYKIPFSDLRAGARGVSLLLDGSIGVKTYFYINEDHVSSAKIDCAVYDMTDSSLIYSTTLTPLYDGEKDLYYTVTYVAPKDVNDYGILNTIDLGSYKLSLTSVSVADYIKELKLLAEEDDEYAKALGVVASLETYAAYADSYFNGGAALTPIEAEGDVDAIASPVRSGSLDGFTHKYTSLILEDRTTIRHYFSHTDSLADYEFEIDGKTVEAVEISDGYAYVDIPDIAAHDLDEVYTLTVNGTLNVSYSALGYVKLAGDSDDESLQGLVNSLYNYWYNAEEYAK